MGKKIPFEVAERLAAVHHNSENDPIFMDANKYGYKVKINHPKIRPIYERYKRKIGCQILSDRERLEFEAFIIRKYIEFKNNGGTK